VDRPDLFPDVPRARTEHEYVETVVSLISDLESTRKSASRLREHVVASDSRFADRLAALYRRIDACTHAHGEIPAGSFGEGQDDLILASRSRPLRKRVKVFLRTLTGTG
jgi:hypothetical protein